MVVVTAEDIPGENVVSLIDDDQPVLVPIGGEIRHQAEPCALIAAPDRATLREAKRHARLSTERLPAVFDPLASDRQFAEYTVARGDAAGAMATADLGDRGTYRVGHQESLHRDPGDDRHSARGRRHDNPRLAAVPLLHPQGDEARARDG